MPQPMSRRAAKSRLVNPTRLPLCRIGSIAAGLVLAWTTGDLRILLLAGFCGAFTTFSGFGWEAHRLWDASRRAFWAAVVVMPVACVAGFLIAGKLAGLSS